MANERIGVLLMAYGSPASLDDVEAYSTHIRGGRKPTSEQLEGLKERYRAIGGRSPLLEITHRQAQALEAYLNEATGPKRWRVYVGMKHWHPFIAEAAEQMAREGIQQAIALALAPHYSRLSVGGYIQAVQEALEKLAMPFPVTFIESWHDYPLFLRAIAQRIDAALRRFPDSLRAQVPVIFTAHSLPERILKWGDPYPTQLRESCEGVAKLVGLQHWRFAYQSAGHTPEPWLGPDVLNVIADLGQQGHEAVLICPIGFVADHLEILYDIDVECRKQADSLGMQLERTESLNDDVQFIEVLAGIIQRCL
ncbi:MAG: ferrochelatase [Candidatus Bipolaricaulia bacterium]